MIDREGRWLPDWPFYPGVTPQRTANVLLTGKDGADIPQSGFNADAFNQTAFFERNIDGTGALQASVAIGGTKARAQLLLAPYAKNAPRLMTVAVAGVMGTVEAGVGGPVDYSGTGALAVALSLAGSGSLVEQNLTGTGALAAVLTLAGSGTANVPITGTGALAFTATLSGAGVQGRTGTGALAFAATLAGTGAKSIAGTGALGVSGAISGDGTTSGLVVEPEGTQKPAGGSTPRRRRVIEDDEEELEETAEEVIERLLEAARVESVPQRRVVRRIATRAAEVAEAPTLEAAQAVVGEVDALLARINAQAADRYLTDLVALRLVMEQIAAQAAEDDDEEALMLLL